MDGNWEENYSIFPLPSTKATLSDNIIILAGKATLIPPFTRAVIPMVNSTTGIGALDSLSCGGFNGDGMFNEFGTSKPSPTNPTGIPTIRWCSQGETRNHECYCVRSVLDVSYS
jgi:hypothetical protein